MLKDFEREDVFPNYFLIINHINKTAALKFQQFSEVRDIPPFSFTKISTLIVECCSVKNLLLNATAFNLK